MPRRHVVKDLSEEEFEFVIQRILDGDTDRALSVAFESKFDKSLAKSSLNRWREATGNELAERYRLARYQAKQLLENLKEEEGADKHQLVMRSIEDRLLTATREVITADPLKLLRIRQQEKKRELQERTLHLKERALEFQQEKASREATLQVDRFEIAASAWQFILRWFALHDAPVVDKLTGRSEELLKDLEAHIENQNS